jgi:hypothetical protein
VHGLHCLAPEMAAAHNTLLQQLDTNLQKMQLAVSLWHMEDYESCRSWSNFRGVSGHCATAATQ